MAGCYCCIFCGFVIGLYLHVATKGFIDNFFLFQNHFFRNSGKFFELNPGFMDLYDLDLNPEL